MSVRDFLDREPFHAIALAAFVEQACAEGCWPDSEATKRRAYTHYEREVAKRPLGLNPASDSRSAYPASAG